MSKISKSASSRDAIGSPTTLRLSQPVKKMLLERDDKIVVTGASGWLGRATLEMLDECLGDRMFLRVHAFCSIAREIQLTSGRTIVCPALLELASVPPAPCIILHYAFLTRARVGTLPLRDFIEANTNIGDFMELQAGRIRARGMFVPSSGAVYRDDNSIDDDIELNPYGVLKARDESRFKNFSTLSNTKVIQCRVFNLAGPFANKLNTYALTSILLDIANKGPIRLMADRQVFRSYFHIGDLVNLWLALLLENGPAPKIFDTAGDKVVEIGDLAKLAAELCGRPDIEIIRPVLINQKADNYVGSPFALNDLMYARGFKATSLDEQILDTARYIEAVR